YAVFCLKKKKSRCPIPTRSGATTDTDQSRPPSGDCSTVDTRGRHCCCVCSARRPLAVSTASRGERLLPLSGRCSGWRTCSRASVSPPDPQHGCPLDRPADGGVLARGYGGAAPPAPPYAAGRARAADAGFGVPAQRVRCVGAADRAPVRVAPELTVVEALRGF